MKKLTYSNIALQLFLGLIIADFISGILHWFEDNYIDYCTDLPILKDIARDNEMHHYFPRSIIAYSNIEHTSYTLPFSIIFIICVYIFKRPMLVKYPYFLFSLILFSATSNITHSIVHKRDCENNWFIIFLQKCGILCSHEHHSRHHTLSYEKYCVILQINNYILDTILFWRGLEYIIYLITNKKAIQKPTYDEYSSIHNHMHANAKLKCPDKPTKEDVDELFKKLDEYKKCYSNMLSNTAPPADDKNPRKKYCMNGRHAKTHNTIPTYCIGCIS